MTAKADQLAWYWRRLRAMSLDELVARIILAARKIGWRKRKSWRAPKPKLRSDTAWSHEGLFTNVGSEKASILAEAQTYLDQGLELLNVHFDKDIDWHLDPQTGVRSPLILGLDINYRDRHVAGNVKNIWEINRHQHLTLIAEAYALSGDEKYSLEVERQLTSWLDANPFPLGINWHSSLELAMRLISWVWIERLLRGSPSHNTLFGKCGKLWESVYWHQWFIYRCRSYGSSSANHLVGEVSGLYIAALVWPFFSESSKWRATARQILERESSRQAFPSGVNREQAFSYHGYCLELFLLAALEAKRYQEPFSAQYQGWIRRMLEVIPMLIDRGGNLPRYGDEDGGQAIRLRATVSSRVEWLYWLGVHVVGARVPTIQEDISVAAAVAGLPQASPETSRGYEAPRGSVAIEDAGYYILALNRDTENEVFCLADAGPLGFGNIAGHGHADALAFTLSIGGTPVIVDPGTYCYFAESDQRNYFRGTKSHNTVTVDGVDQSVSGGAFLWTRKANSRAINWQAEPGNVELIAEHDGYAWLEGNVKHRRTLSLSEDGLLVDDELFGTGEHLIEWRLHFHPDTEVLLNNDECHASWEGGTLRIVLDSGLDWEVMRGQQNGGWYSPQFNVKIPTSTLVGAIRTALPHTVQNVIRVAMATESGGAGIAIPPAR